MKNIILFISISMAAGLLFVNLYNSMVDAKSWGGNIPGSISTAREYFKIVTPGSFFRVFSPLTQVVGLLTLILFWKSAPDVRLYLFIAFGCYVAGDIFTFAYFYPRNAIMFETAALTDVAQLHKAWSGWSAMNWLRSGIIMAGLFFSCLSLHKIYSLQ